MASAKRIDTASRVIHSSVEAVYAAFADEHAWRQWLPPTGMACKIDGFDFREGGTFRITLIYTDGSDAGKTTADADVTVGTFVEIKQNKRVVQRIDFESDDPAFAGAMLMTWSLESLPDGTRVIITAENVPEGISPEDHAAGLQSTLENLARFVEQPG